MTIAKALAEKYERDMRDLQAENDRLTAELELERQDSERHRKKADEQWKRAETLSAESSRAFEAGYYAGYCDRANDDAAAPVRRYEEYTDSGRQEP